MQSMIPTIIRFERDSSTRVVGPTRADRPPTFLDELDERQDDVLRQLDELNVRIEALLIDWAPLRDPPDPVRAGCLAD
jgi:hypothetical protein